LITLSRKGRRPSPPSGCLIYPLSPRAQSFIGRRGANPPAREPAAKSKAESWPRATPNQYQPPPAV
jgi:hypothetical protein